MKEVLQKTPSTILQNGINSSWGLHVAELLRRQLHVPQKAKLVWAGYVLTNIEQTLGNDIYLDFQMKHGNLALFASLMEDLPYFNVFLP